MNEISDTADIRRRISLVEQESDGERRVTRHILRKATDNERLLLDVRAEVGEMRKDVSELRSEIALLRADLPSIIASAVGALLREGREPE